MTPGATPIRIALLGDDIATSLSPRIHRAEAAALGLAGFDYQAVDLAAEADAHGRLGQIMGGLLTSGYTGFNITHPYKQSIIRFLDGLSPQAEALGAVNVVVCEAGKLIGHNTDQSGFLAALQRNLPADAERHEVALFGAGGAGSAVAHALLEFGVQALRIIDTDAGRLDSLASLLRSRATAGVQVDTGTPERATDWVPQANAVVNATPVGMEQIPGIPLDPTLLRSHHWVADVIYRPVDTELLRAAAARGCRTVQGTGMFIEQAADTFALLTGDEPNRERLRNELSLVLGAPVGSRETRK
ncbi:shikimate dehydrogenase [Glutamicibacter sp. MNS18]|uniref:shikimate dehydrogenase n=1 Tax=Glutamicibacter sp. MNS18 TaxID=2989817 RepID=UPI002235A7E3|nr:shikimate dehydrogenase [Glutamicibacter sp. MNS18]MCW4464729.1 shikimate dehydrogenase [Glutamicibacter sp. MNS18]